ncbi:MAG: ATPase [Acidilobaceae archaeon]
MRLAFLSGGKDSYYAMVRAGGADVGLLVLYDFPRPSPHIINLGKSLESLSLLGLPIIAMRAERGKEMEQKASLLSRLGVKEIVAGDVYVESHLRYMEELAGRAGARLLEPLWGRDPGELLLEEMEAGIVGLVIGAERRLEGWLGREIGRENAEEFAEYAAKVGADPLGERGEYHTLVLQGPMHRQRVNYKPLWREEHDDYLILRVT